VYLPRPRQCLPVAYVIYNRKRPSFSLPKVPVYHFHSSGVLEPSADVTIDLTCDDDVEDAVNNTRLRQQSSGSNSSSCPTCQELETHFLTMTQDMMSMPSQFRQTIPGAITSAGSLTTAGVRYTVTASSSSASSVVFTDPVGLSSTSLVSSAEIPQVTVSSSPILQVPRYSATVRSSLPGTVHHTVSSRMPSVSVGSTSASVSQRPAVLSHAISNLLSSSMSCVVSRTPVTLVRSTATLSAPLSSSSRLVASSVVELNNAASRVSLAVASSSMTVTARPPLQILRPAPTATSASVGRPPAPERLAAHNSIPVPRVTQPTQNYRAFCLQPRPPQSRPMTFIFNRVVTTAVQPQSNVATVCSAASIASPRFLQQYRLFMAQVAPSVVNCRPLSQMPISQPAVPVVQNISGGLPVSWPAGLSGGNLVGRNTPQSASTAVESASTLTDEFVDIESIDPSQLAPIVIAPDNCVDDYNMPGHTVVGDIVVKQEQTSRVSKSVLRQRRGEVICIDEDEMDDDDDNSTDIGEPVDAVSSEFDFSAEPNTEPGLPTSLADVNDDSSDMPVLSANYDVPAINIVPDGIGCESPVHTDNMLDSDGFLPVPQSCVDDSLSTPSVVSNSVLQVSSSESHVYTVPAQPSVAAASVTQAVLITVLPAVLSVSTPLSSPVSSLPLVTSATPAPTTARTSDVTAMATQLVSALRSNTMRQRAKVAVSQSTDLESTSDGSRKRHARTDEAESPAKSSRYIPPILNRAYRSTKELSKHASTSVNKPDKKAEKHGETVVYHLNDDGSIEIRIEKGSISENAPRRKKNTSRHGGFDAIVELDCSTNQSWCSETLVSDMKKYFDDFKVVKLYGDGSASSRESQLVTEDSDTASVKEYRPPADTKKSLPVAGKKAPSDDIGSDSDSQETLVLSSIEPSDDENDEVSAVETGKEGSAGLKITNVCSLDAEAFTDLNEHVVNANSSDLSQVAVSAGQKIPAETSRQTCSDVNDDMPTTAVNRGESSEDTGAQRDRLDADNDASVTTSHINLAAERCTEPRHRSSSIGQDHEKDATDLDQSGDTSLFEVSLDGETITLSPQRTDEPPSDLEVLSETDGESQNLPADGEGFPAKHLSNNDRVEAVDQQPSVLRTEDGKCTTEKSIDEAVLTKTSITSKTSQLSALDECTSSVMPRLLVEHGQGDTSVSQLPAADDGDGNRQLITEEQSNYSCEFERQGSHVWSGSERTVEDKAIEKDSAGRSLCSVEPTEDSTSDEDEDLPPRLLICEVDESTESSHVIDITSNKTQTTDPPNAAVGDNNSHLGNFGNGHLRASAEDNVARGQKAPSPALMLIAKKSVSAVCHIPASLPEEPSDTDVEPDQSSAAVIERSVVESVGTMAMVTENSKVPTGHGETSSHSKESQLESTSLPVSSAEELDPAAECGSSRDIDTEPVSALSKPCGESDHGGTTVIGQSLSVADQLASSLRPSYVLLTDIERVPLTTRSACNTAADLSDVEPEQSQDHVPDFENENSASETNCQLGNAQSVSSLPEPPLAAMQKPVPAVQKSSCLASHGQSRMSISPVPEATCDVQADLCEPEGNDSGFGLNSSSIPITVTEESASEPSCGDQFEIKLSSLSVFDKSSPGARPVSPDWTSKSSDKYTKSVVRSRTGHASLEHCPDSDDKPPRKLHQSSDRTLSAIRVPKKITLADYRSRKSASQATLSDNICQEVEQSQAESSCEEVSKVDSRSEGPSAELASEVQSCVPMVTSAEDDAANVSISSQECSYGDGSDNTGSSDNVDSQQTAVLPDNISPATDVAGSASCREEMDQTVGSDTQTEEQENTSEMVDHSTRATVLADECSTDGHQTDVQVTEAETRTNVQVYTSCDDTDKVQVLSPDNTEEMDQVSLASDEKTHLNCGTDATNTELSLENTETLVSSGSDSELAADNLDVEAASEESAAAQSLCGTDAEILDDMLLDHALSRREKKAKSKKRKAARKPWKFTLIPVDIASSSNSESTMACGSADSRMLPKHSLDRDYEVNLNDHPVTVPLEPLGDYSHFSAVMGISTDNVVDSHSFDGTMTETSPIMSSLNDTGTSRHVAAQEESMLRLSSKTSLLTDSSELSSVVSVEDSIYGSDISDGLHCSETTQKTTDNSAATDSDTLKLDVSAKARVASSAVNIQAKDNVEDIAVPTCLQSACASKSCEILLPSSAAIVETDSESAISGIKVTDKLNVDGKPDSSVASLSRPDLDSSPLTTTTTLSKLKTSSASHLSPRVVIVPIDSQMKTSASTSAVGRWKHGSRTVDSAGTSEKLVKPCAKSTGCNKLTSQSLPSSSEMPCKTDGLTKSTVGKRTPHASTASVVKKGGRKRNKSEPKTGHLKAATMWQDSMRDWVNVDMSRHKDVVVPYFTLSNDYFVVRQQVSRLMKSIVKLAPRSKDSLRESISTSLKETENLLQEELVYVDVGTQLNNDDTKLLVEKQLHMTNLLSTVETQLRDLSAELYNMSDAEAELSSYEKADWSTESCLHYNILLLTRHMLYKEMSSLRCYHNCRLVYRLPDEFCLDVERDRFISVEGSILFLEYSILSLAECRQLLALKVEIEEAQCSLAQVDSQQFGSSEFNRLGWLHYRRKQKLDSISVKSFDSLRTLQAFLAQQLHWYR